MSEARALALFVAALGPAAGALLAWVPREMSASRLLALALGLALAVAFGEAVQPGHQVLRDRSTHRIRIWVLAFAAGIVFLSLAFAAAAPRPALLGRQTLLVLTVELTFLIVPGLGPGRLPALMSALALTILAAFRGGAMAALSLTSYVSGLVVFLVLDHFAERLAQHPAAVPALRGLVFTEGLRLLAPVLLTLALFFVVVPPRPHAGLNAATIDALNREQLASAYLQLAVFALVGAMVVQYASRLLGRKRDGKPKVTEAVMPERGREELIAERPMRIRPDYGGPRGAIVRAYVRFLAEAGANVLVRRPDQTPEEIARQLASAGAPLPRLTALFGGARYGPADPSAADVGEAERLSAALLRWLQARRDKGNAASSRQSETSPSVRTT